MAISKALQAQIDQLNGNQKKEAKQESRNDSGISPGLQGMLDQLGQSRIDSVLDNWAELGFTSRLDAEIKLNHEANYQSRMDAQKSITSRRKARSLPQVNMDAIGHNSTPATVSTNQSNYRTDEKNLTNRRKNRPLPSNNY